VGKKKIRIGIVGAGRIAEAHASGYAKLRTRATLVGIVGGELENVRHKAEQWGVQRVYENLVEMIQNADIDAVDICLPHHLHLDAVRRACDGHKHILLEKPIARTTSEADMILEAVRLSGVKFMVAHNHMFNPIVRKAKEIIDKGLIGRIHLVKAASFGWFFFTDTDFRRSSEKTGGGVLIDTGVHFIYVLQYLLGKISSVTTVQGRLVREEMQGEDTVVVALRFADGAIGEITASYASRVPAWEKGFPEGWEQTIHLAGTEGALRFSLTDNTLWFYSETEMPSTLKPSSGWTSIKIDNAYATSFDSEVAQFVNYLHGETLPPSGGAEGRKTLEVVEAAYRSAAENRTVYLANHTA
jgi:predicted dehydrogenase